jgi:outer membrane biosynthesis protein TonB
MSANDMANASFRQERADYNRLVWAMIFSLLFHLCVVGTYETGKKFHWWERWHFPNWFQPPMLTELLKKKDAAAAQKRKEEEVPLVFLDVSPDQAAAEPPKDAKYYSDKNSIAANSEADKETDTPKITGTQTDVPMTKDVPREKEFTSLQPTPPQAPVTPQPRVEQKPKPAEAPGDLTMAKPDQQPRKETGDAPLPKPRTVTEALIRKHLSEPPGEKMKQEGGVRRRLELTSFDAKATPFGAYDAAMVEAIRQRWFTLLDERSYASDSRGKVVLRFQLHSDGRITDMDVPENSTTEMLGLICQKAVLDPAPYAQWPAEMRRILGEIRKIQFTFYYQ